ncbi:MAG: methylated-DNA--[protein]-cysteine S-methyltransferase, partial [Thermotogae bacterium]|nr:methylated-DNA--[protein]-cysteine S-methyltransferase [Thermotogota bacterium]
MRMGIVTTDIGSVILHVEEGYLVKIELTEKALLPVDLPPFTSQLVEYFQKERTSFSLNFRVEGTDFQRKVWQTLMKIPYGSVVTYCGLSKELFG